MEGKEEGVRLVQATETLFILATESSALFTGLHFLECKAIAFDHFLPCNGISHFLIFSLLYTCSLNCKHSKPYLEHDESQSFTAVRQSRFVRFWNSGDESGI